LGASSTSGQQTTSKNFVVTVANKLGIKIFVSYESNKDHKIRVSFVGKQAGIAAAKEVLSELIANVNNGNDEAVVQAALLKKLNATGDATTESAAPKSPPPAAAAPKSPRAPAAGRVATAGDCAATSVIAPLPFAPTNDPAVVAVMTGGNGVTVDKTAESTPQQPFRVLQRLPALVNAEHGNCETPNTTLPTPVVRDTNNTSSPPPGFRTVPPHVLPGFYVCPDQMYSAIFVDTFTSAFSSAFHAAHAHAVREAKAAAARHTHMF
jgi:hypothetical protein